MEIIIFTPAATILDRICVPYSIKFIVPAENPFQRQVCPSNPGFPFEAYQWPRPFPWQFCHQVQLVPWPANPYKDLYYGGGKEINN